MTPRQWDDAGCAPHAQRIHRPKILLAATPLPTVARGGDPMLARDEGEGEGRLLNGSLAGFAAWTSNEAVTEPCVVDRQQGGLRGP